MTAKLRVATLGCKVNQYETELVRQGLQRVGFEDCIDDEPADVCLVNTCTVTNEGDVKSRQIVRRLNRENPDAKIIVMGCYATRAPDEVAQLPGVTEVVTDKRELPDLMARFGVIDVPTGLDGFSGRQRAYVKVQDGCLLRCSYCIIPHVRPELTSRPKQHIVDEVQRLIDAGHQEVVLTGIHLGHYGVDWNRNKPREQWVRLAHLVRELCELNGDFRIRLSSIEATEVTRGLIDVMQEYSDRVVPHLHLCLQVAVTVCCVECVVVGGRKCSWIDAACCVNHCDCPPSRRTSLLGFQARQKRSSSRRWKPVEQQVFPKSTRSHLVHVVERQLRTCPIRFQNHCSQNGSAD